jgi:hypothetical protein
MGRGVPRPGFRAVRPVHAEPGKPAGGSRAGLTVGSTIAQAHGGRAWAQTIGVPPLQQSHGTFQAGQRRRRHTEHATEVPGDQLSWPIPPTGRGRHLRGAMQAA